MNAPRIMVLSGGVGGAKLSLGMYQILEPDELAVLVNTGDDFEHLGLWISPDIDTTLYTLGGVVDPQRGWGRRDESWRFMAVLEQLGGETWFGLGDGDLALHVERTRRLTNGEALSRIMADLAQKLGVRARIIPMSDQKIATRVTTPEGELGFQDYFVRQRCAPVVKSLCFEGADKARMADGVDEILGSDDLQAIFIAPSNPYLSIDPILAVPGLRGALKAAGVPIVAITPLIAGDAIKGPTAKIMKELDIASSASAVARHYGDLIDGFVLDTRDARLKGEISAAVALTDTLMKTEQDRQRVAQVALELARALPRRRKATP